MHLSVTVEVMASYDRSEFKLRLWVGPGLHPQTHILASGKQQIRKKSSANIAPKSRSVCINIVSVLVLIFQLPRSSAHIY